MHRCCIGAAEGTRLLNVVTPNANARETETLRCAREDRRRCEANIGNNALNPHRLSRDA